MGSVDDYVIEFAVAERVANGMAFGTDPVRCPRFCDEVSYCWIVEKGGGVDEDAVCDVARVHWFGFLADDMISDSRFDSVAGYD